MTEDILTKILDGVTEEMRCETGETPSGWMVAKRLASKFEEKRTQCVEIEQKYHELLHRTGGL